MSALMTRIFHNRSRSATPKPNQTATPVGSSDLRAVGINDAATETPLVRIRIFPGVISYDEGFPLIASDGAPISGTGYNEWSQLYAAGRM